MTGRDNQKARTRAAIVAGAVEILREGRDATVPEAAERALVSAATAYRYFASAEELQHEASAALVAAVSDGEVLGRAIEAAGEDVHARLEVLVRTLGRRMLTDPAPFRQTVKAGLERWFAQRRAGADPVEVRPGMRNRFLRQVVAPIEGQLAPADHERLLAALAVGFGTEAVISLTDVARLDPEAALEVMLATCRWILDGALAEAGWSFGGRPG